MSIYYNFNLTAVGNNARNTKCKSQEYTLLFYSNNLFILVRKYLASLEKFIKKYLLPTAVKFIQDIATARKLLFFNYEYFKRYSIRSKNCNLLKETSWTANLSLLKLLCNVCTWFVDHLVFCQSSLLYCDGSFGRLENLRRLLIQNKKFRNLTYRRRQRGLRTFFYFFYLGFTI